MKQISPTGLILISEALTHIFWRKDQHRKFIQSVLNEHKVQVHVNWDLKKRETSDAIVSRLAKEHREVLLSFVQEICKMENFEHLSREQDGQKLIANATQAVKALKAYAANHLKNNEEKISATKRTENETHRLKEINTFNQNLESIKNAFYKTTTLSPQKRGFELERIFRELLSLFEMEPKSSYKINGEQIDGSFVFENFEYLLEIKWESNPLSASSVYSFKGKITNKLDNTLGFFLSMSGFTNEAIEAVDRSDRKVCLLSDYNDLLAVLEGRIGLDELIRRKKKFAAQTGKSFLPIRDIL